MFDIIGVGAHSVDQVYRLPQAPTVHGPHSKLRVTSHSVSCGGQVATALATAAALGLKAAYAGAIGTDARATLILDALVSRGVDLSLVVHKAGGSQFAVILVDDQSGERVVLWDRPDSLMLTDDELPHDLGALARAVIVDDVDPRAALVVTERATSAGLPVVTDLDHPTPFTLDIIRTASHPVMSEHLPAALTGEADLETALRQLRRTAQGLLVVTCGRDGAVALDGDRFVRAGGFAVTPVDTTGSGDVFRGAFVAGLLRGLDTASLLRYANAAAAVSCTRAGALGGVPTATDVDARLRAG